jgi:hypothetical protein
VSRRVSLPTADDLFRPTDATEAPTEVREPRPERRVRAVPTTTDGPDESRSRRPSGRVRHDEKMTVYVTAADELLDLEDATPGSVASTASRSTGAGWCARRSRSCSPTSRSTATTARRAAARRGDDPRRQPRRGHRGGFRGPARQLREPFDLAAEPDRRYSSTSPRSLSRVTDEQFIAHVKAEARVDGVTAPGPSSETKSRRSSSSPPPCS